MIILQAVKRKQQRKDNRMATEKVNALDESPVRLPNKSSSNSCLYWDVYVITLYAFKKMKSLAITTTCQRKSFML